MRLRVGELDKALIVYGERRYAKGVSGLGMTSPALPKIFLAFRTRVASRSVEHRALLTTVLLEPDERRLSLIWQTALPVRQADSEYLDETSIREKRLVS